MLNIFECKWFYSIFFLPLHNLDLMYVTLQVSLGQNKTDNDLVLVLNIVNIEVLYARHLLLAVLSQIMAVSLKVNLIS